jgi:pimeloyl-ACP methyl ester carboxylesterase
MPATPAHLSVALAFALLAPAVLAEPAAAPALKLADCTLRPMFGTRTAEAKCGSWSVAEDPAATGGKRIELFVAVVPARAKERNKAPDPLFILAGGPGQSAVDAYFTMQGGLERILRRRDVVLLDQRGTGKSNRMQCDYGDGQGDYDPAAVERLTRACLAALPGNPALYTTSLAIDDLDAVRQALGYGEINLYGGSYGTRVALSYLKYHEASTRAVIIDAVIPQDLALGPGVPVQSQATLERVIAACAADAGCKASYPTLESDFAAVRARLTKGRVTVAMRDPVDGKPIELKLSYAEMAGAVRLMLYSPETQSLLPLFLRQAAAGDWVPLAAQVALSVRQTTELLALGMHNSVVCTEDAPFYRDDPAERAQIARSYLGGIADAAIAEMCVHWPHGPIKDGFKEPVASAKPVLLLSGELDPITPPEYAARAAATLSNSRHIVAPGQGHTVLARGCIPKLAAEFLDSADPKALDPACVQTLKSAPFFVRFTGPEP